MTSAEGTLVRVDPRVDDRWRTLATQHRASLFHSPEWLTVLSDTYGWAPVADVVVDARGVPVAGVPWCRVSDAGGDRLISLPFSDFGGPIGAGSHEALFDALDVPGVPVRCRMLVDPDELAPRPVVKTARWHGIPVPPEPADAWAALSSSARRAIRKARDEQLVVVERTDVAFLADFLRLHTRVRKDKYRLLPQPLAFFHAIRSRFRAIAAWHPLVAVRDDAILATTVYLHWGDTLYYKFNASDPDELGARPNDLLLWAGIELAARLGCRMVDLGASDDDQPGLIRFKRGFGANEREIRTLTSGPEPSATHAAFRNALAEVTARFTEPEVEDAATRAAGDVLYRYFA